MRFIFSTFLWALPPYCWLRGRGSSFTTGNEWLVASPLCSPVAMVTTVSRVCRLLPLRPFHILLSLLPFVCVWTSVPCAHLSGAAAGAALRLLGFFFSRWNEIVNSFTGVEEFTLFTTNPSKAVCLWSVSQVNMEIRPKLKLSRASQHLCALAAQDIRGTTYAVRPWGWSCCKTNQLCKDRHAFCTESLFWMQKLTDSSPQRIQC